MTIECQECREFQEREREREREKARKKTIECRESDRERDSAIVRKTARARS